MIGLIVIDTETTGFGGKNTCIVELGAVALDADGNELGAFNSLVYPRFGVDLGHPQVQKALSVNRITPAMLNGAPHATAVWDGFCAWGSDFRGFPVSAFNKAFDQRMMDAEEHFAALPWADFCIMQRYKAFAKARGQRKYGLVLAASELGVVPTGELHRALTDARTAGGVWTALKLRGLA